MFMMLTYFVILAAAVLNIALLELTEQKKMDLVEKLHRRTEYAVFFVVPLIYVIFFLFFV